MSHSAPTPPSGAWAGLGAALVRHARPVTLVMLAAALAAGLAAGLLLKVRPGYVDLLDPSSALQRRYLDLLKELGNVEPLTILVESEDPRAAAAASDRLAEAARALLDADGRPLASSVISRVDLRALEDRAAAWLPASEIDRLARLPGLHELVEDPAPDRVLAAVRALLADAAGEQAESRGQDRLEPASLARLLHALDAVARGRAEPSLRAFLSPEGGGAGSQELDPDGRIQLAPGRLVVTVMPADASNDAAILEVLVGGVRAAADEIAAESGARVRIAFTGAPALIVDEMRAVRRDIALASGLSFALVTLLFFVSFNSLRHVAFAVIANACGLALTFGAAWLLVGYLNLFSSVFAAVLAGLGIDFGIHFINFYEARRRDGMGAGPALVDAYAHVVPPIAVSAVTTAAAFLTVMTSEFAGFSQLGLISGVGVLLCLLTAFTLVPSLIAWSARRRPDHPPGSRAPWSMPLLMLPIRGFRAVSLLGIALLAVAAFGASRLRFDHDLMNLQPEGTEAVALQRDGERRVGTHPAFSLATDVRQARERAQALRALPSVRSVQSPADALPLPDASRPHALGRLAAALAATPSEPVAPRPVDLAAARAQATGLRDDLVTWQDLAFEGGLADEVLALDEPIAAAGSLAGALEDPAALPRLQALRDALAASLARMRALLPDLAAQGGVEPSDLPEALRTLVGTGGRLALVVFPKESVWDRPALLRFLGEIRSVDPEVTGPAVQVAEVTELMRLSLEKAGLLAFAVIVALVLLSTRSLPLAALSLMPLVSGFVLMLGAMWFFRVPLNPANLVALPLLLGIGVDGGVHLVHRWHSTRDAGRTVADIGHALLITSLTTVAGFVPLVFAQHRGIRSLGAATCLGSIAMLFSVVILAPAFLSVIDAIRAGRGRDGTAS